MLEAEQTRERNGRVRVRGRVKNVSSTSVVPLTVMAAWYTQSGEFLHAAEGDVGGRLDPGESGTFDSPPTERSSVVASACHSAGFLAVNCRSDMQPTCGLRASISTSARRDGLVSRLSNKLTPGYALRLAQCMDKELGPRSRRPTTQIAVLKAENSPNSVLGRNANGGIRLQF